MGVADLADRLAGNLGIIKHGFSCDLAGDNYKAGCHECLTSDARLWVGSQCRVKYRIRDLVGDFVGMAFSD